MAIDGKFTDDNQPKERKPRGKSFKTLLLETMREKSQLKLSPASTKEQAEKAFIDHCATRAFNPDDNASGTILREFLNKSFPGLKSTLEKIKFDFPEDGTPTQKSLSVVKAISDGALPADVGQTIISIIKDSVVIEEGTDLKARIEQLEEIINK